MRTDVKKCSAHNRILRDRETCPACADAERARVLAAAGPRSARVPKPWASPWENREPPEPVQFQSGKAVKAAEDAQLLRLFADVQAACLLLSTSPEAILPLRDSKDYGDACQMILDHGFQPHWLSFGTQGAVAITHRRQDSITEEDCEEEP